MSKKIIARYIIFIDYLLCVIIYSGLESIVSSLEYNKQDEVAINSGEDIHSEGEDDIVIAATQEVVRMDGDYVDRYEDGVPKFGALYFKGVDGVTYMVRNDVGEWQEGLNFADPSMYPIFNAGDEVMYIGRDVVHANVSQYSAAHALKRKAEMDAGVGFVTNKFKKLTPPGSVEQTPVPSPIPTDGGYSGMLTLSGSLTDADMLNATEQVVLGRAVAPPRMFGASLTPFQGSTQSNPWGMSSTYPASPPKQTVAFNPAGFTFAPPTSNKKQGTEQTYHQYGIAQQGGINTQHGIGRGAPMPRPKLGLSPPSTRVQDTPVRTLGAFDKPRMPVALNPTGQLKRMESTLFPSNFTRQAQDVPRNYVKVKPADLPCVAERKNGAGDVTRGMEAVPPYIPPVVDTLNMLCAGVDKLGYTARSSFIASKELELALRGYSREVNAAMEVQNSNIQFLAAKVNELLQARATDLKVKHVPIMVNNVYPPKLAIKEVGTKSYAKLEPLTYGEVPDGPLANPMYSIRALDKEINEMHGQLEQIRRELPSSYLGVQRNEKWTGVPYPGSGSSNSNTNRMSNNNTASPKNRKL